MGQQPNAAKLDRPMPADEGTFVSGEVPVRRTSIALARRFFQICTTAAAETLAETGLTTLQFAVMVSLSSVTGEPGRPGVRVGTSLTSLPLSRMV